MPNEFTAKTIEEAVDLGLKQLNLTLENAEYVIVDQPSKGFMGLGSKPAKIIMSKRKTDADRAVDFLDGLFELLNITATSQVSEENEERIVINLTTLDSSQSSSTLIGYRGEVLDSFQCLAGAIANKTNEEYKRVVVDCEGYRARREATLRALAQRLAKKAIDTKRKVTVEPMNPFERRIFHSELVDTTGIKTISEGKEPLRYIVIIPDNYDPKMRQNNRGYGGKSKDGYNKFDKKGRGFGDKKDNRFPKRDGEKSFSRPPKKDKPVFSNSVFLGNSLKDEKSES